MLDKMKGSGKVWGGILVVELAIILVSGLLYNRRETVDLSFTQDELVSDLGENMFYIDRSYDHTYVATPEFTLPRGLYTLEVEYDSVGEVRVEVCHSDGENIAGNIAVSEYQDSLRCDFRVNSNNRTMYVKGRLSGDAVDGDYLLIRNIHITTAHMGMRNSVFMLGVALLLIDGVLALWLLRDRVIADVEIRLHTKILILLILLCSLPLTVNYLSGSAHDLKFHLTRLEGIKDGLLNGVFPVKIQSNWLGGEGYAVSVFYGDMLLYIPAILRVFGVSIQASYNFYVLFINAITVGIAYHCFTKMSDRKIGLLATFIYSFNIFRLYDIYTRAAVGEYTAMAFLPLVLYGLWKVYSLPEESKEHEKSWITITIGCLGIFLSHMLSTEMTALFVIITVVILWKRTLRKANLKVLLKAIGATLLLSLWFLVPFLDYMMSETYAFTYSGRYEPYKLEGRSGFLVQLFMTSYDVIGVSGGIGVAGWMPYTLGLASILILIGWFVFCMGEKARDKAKNKEEYLAVFLCVLSLFLTMKKFPYTWLVNKIPILQFAAQSLQYPMRFFAVAGVLLAWLLCVVMRKEWIDDRKKKIFGGVLLILSIWQGLAFISEFMDESSVYYIYQGGGLGYDEIMMGEYIPVIEAEDIYVSEFKEKYTSLANVLTYDADAINVEEWYRENGNVIVDVQNLSGEKQQLEVPLILYKGYKAYTDNGKELELQPGNLYRATVTIPAGYCGEISVGFYEPWYWRVCEILSLVTLVGIAFYEVRKTFCEKAEIVVDS